MKIIIDRNIPFIQGVLEPWADIVYAGGSQISHDMLRDADALIIRTRTRCDKKLLDGSKLRFIGTASIGTDHIDLEWCSAGGIKCVSAPGCNSGSVMQYLASSLAYLAVKYDMEPAGTILGVVGVGNTGSKVAQMAEILGFKVLLNDPPRQRIEGGNAFCSINELLKEADIVSMHVPLSFEGPDKTYQMVNESFLSRMKRKAILINTSRGQVADEKALLALLGQSEVKTAVLDVWINEPDINTVLLDAVDLGTPHIAGYSTDGKANATKIIIRQLADYFDLPLKDWEPVSLPDAAEPVIDISGFTGSEIKIISQVISHTCPLERDSGKLKNNPALFEKLRNEYPPRREFHAYSVKSDNELLLNKLRKLGFK
ncbi:MAG: DUF3410 domain-containing protein [Bacteroidales bacterium]|nr:DUF3410 domain-containing protein [Bacteroidales bacterium]